MKTSIFDIDNWREIGATLAKNKTRTFLTAFGIFWGTAMLAMLMGGSRGLENTLNKQFEGFATNSAIVSGGRRSVSYKGFNKGSSWSVTNSDLVQMLHNFPELDAAAATSTINSCQISNGKRSTTAPLQGVTTDFNKIFLPTIYSGRFINSTDEMRRQKVCVLGVNVANQLFDTGVDPLGTFVAIHGINYKVVGIAGQTADAVQIGGNTVDEIVICPMSTTRSAFNLGDEVDYIIYVAKSGVKPATIQPRISRMLKTNHCISPDDENAIMNFDLSEQFAMVDSLMLGVTMLALFVGLGTLIAGIIGVGNIMWVIVKERTTEIGIRRAIGAKPIDIVTQILSEGVALTFVAGTAGIIFAVLVLAAATTMLDAQFQITFSQAFAILITFVVLGVAASLIPSIKAMKIKPIEAINDK